MPTSKERYSFMSQFVFKGLTPYIEKAAVAADINAVHLVKCQTIWHCGQIQNALGQIPRLDAQHRGALMQHAEDIRASLAAVLAGIDAAIDEVKTECAMHAPADLKPIRRRPGLPPPEHSHTTAAPAEGS